MDYLNELADCFDEIMDIVPEELDDFLDLHPKFNLSEYELNQEFVLKKEEGTSEDSNAEECESEDDDEVGDGSDVKQKKYVFWKKIVGIMGYSHVRDSIIVPYIVKQKIRTCVYCNAEYLTYVDGKKKVKNKDTPMGRYQIDHFKPQSLYPFLCISFFNFQPSCNFCNLWKSNEPEIEFNLYTKKVAKIDPFTISLDEKSVKDYVLSHKIESLKIIIDAPNDPDLIESHNSVFEINKLYQFHKDEAEEIIWNALIYNESSIEQLKKTYEKLVGENTKDFGRILYGFYCEETNIHIRPLTKMRQDVFEQIKKLSPEIMKVIEENARNV